MADWDRRLRRGALLLVLWAGCGSYGGGPIDAGRGLRDGGFSGADGSVGLPPEMEVEVDFEPPAVGESVLYATNPATGRVAVIHADDFSIETVRVGPGPSPAVAAPGRDLALSIQRGESTVTVLRTVDRVTTALTLELDHDANAAAFGPNGRYAVLFEAPRPDLTRRNFQDVSIIDLTDGAERVVRAVVGYGPSEVVFDPAGATAIVVTEDGICPIDLVDLPDGGMVRAPLLRFDSLAPIAEAHITPDGVYAIALVDQEIQQLDLRDGTVLAADLSRLATEGVVEITDVDISPDGAEVLVVLRSHEMVVRLTLGPTIADSAEWVTLGLEGYSVGSLVFSPSGGRVVAYTTNPAIESIVVLDLVGNTAQEVPLRKSVRALAISPDGAFALALHHAIAEPTSLGEDAVVDASEGYTVVDLETGFARLALVDAAPQPDGFVLDRTSEHLMVALRDDARGVRELQIVDLATFAVDRVPLLAPPTTVGAFPELERAFIGQEADGGRVTFYLWNERETHTVAGFELAARVRQ